MLYRPQKGKIKDGCMVYEKGVFYLFSMYHKENSDKFNNIWLATSKDGVHFKDFGCVVEDFPDLIWAMKVYRGEDAFYMNSGSFNADGKQAVLKFWRSEDLLHWEYRPELDVESPDAIGSETRLDCMNVVNYKGKYYGYATGQYSFLVSDDGAHWKALPSNISYAPFPEYNKALGGFEVADCIELNDKFYMFCGGFGHLGMNGYGVYIYESHRPEGPFKPCLPNYRINGTSKRWVNMWERFFEKDGDYLAHNYMYDGYSYEEGSVWLPPIKKLSRDNNGLFLQWWKGNERIYSSKYKEQSELVAENSDCGVFDSGDNNCSISEIVEINSESIVELTLEMQENKFTAYSSGGIYLSESENSGTAIIFDTFGKCEIVYIKDRKLILKDDVVGFGSAAPYWMEGGKKYSIRLLVKNGLFEIYVDDRYLQTFNTTHFKAIKGKTIKGIGCISLRRKCMLSDIKIYEMSKTIIDGRCLL